MKLSEIPLITQNLYDSKRTSLNGWFHIPKGSVCEILINDSLTTGERISFTDQYLFFENGNLHRHNGFCRVTNDVNSKYFEAVSYLNNINHADGRPAFLIIDREILWDGEDFILHKESEVVQSWYMHNGKFHRLDGPALITPNHESYIIYGKDLTAKEFLNHPMTRKLTVSK